MQLGERVRARMEVVGINQSQLARAVGLTQPAIYALLTRNKTGSKHLHLIARELGTTPAYLSGETDDPNADLPAPPDLDSVSREIVDRLGEMSQADRRALLQIARSMTAGPPASDTVHPPPAGAGKNQPNANPKQEKPDG